MANSNMIKFYRGLLANLPATGENGALYITTDEGSIYYGTGTGMKRLGDYIMVDAIENLPTDGANATSLYYCVKENVLCRYDSVNSKWVQINKQPTAEEMKTLLGLGSLAYKSEVAEGDLNADLLAKVNASAEGNHSHSNKDVIDGITADKVTAWDGAEQNAKDYADGLNTAMNTRVEALEAIDHDHENKAELDLIATGDKAKWDAAAEKAHTHTFVETELNKIVDGDVAKWNAVAADYLDSEDKTALENSIKEAKKAGTDANTNIEAYKVTNDARVLAVEEDIAEIVDGTNGILAQAKTYSDGKLATARTEISAEIDADVKVVADDLAGYKTTNDAALAGVKATAEAAATKVYTDEELAKKVDKVEGKSLVLDTEITKLAGVSTGANKVEKSDTNGNIKIDGVETVVYTHPEKHAIADVTGLQDALDGLQAKGDYAADDHKHTKADITDFAHTHIASEITDLDATIKGYDYATKTEAQGYADAKDEAIAAALKAGTDAQADVDALETYVGTFTHDTAKTVVEYINAKTDGIATSGNLEALGQRVAAIEDDYLKGEHKTELEGKIDLKADKSVVDAMYTNDQIDGFIAAEKERAEGIEAGLRTDVDAIKADYLTSADKTELEGKITDEENRAKGVEESLQTQINTIMNNPDAEGAINSINEFTQYVADHGTIAEGFRTDIDKNKEDIAANAKAIADQATSDAATYETKTDASAKLVEAKEYADGVVATEKAAREAADAELAAAIETAKTDAANQDAVVLAEAQKYADQAKADAIADAASKYETKGTAQGIVDGLKLSETYEAIGAEERAIAAAEGKVNALAATVYTKDEVDAAVEAAVTAASTWGEF